MTVAMMNQSRQSRFGGLCNHCKIYMVQYKGGVTLTLEEAASCHKDRIRIRTAAAARTAVDIVEGSMVHSEANSRRIRQERSCHSLATRRGRSLLL